MMLTVFFASNYNKIMKYNSFDYYEQLRQYQLHLLKLQNPEKKVPTHEAFKPPCPNPNRKEFERNQKQQQIEKRNEQIMEKLVSINRRKVTPSKGGSSLSLPSLKKNFSIPEYTA